MRADFRVVLDACVLAPANLCELLLCLAETPRLYLPFWSEEILTEVRRTQTTKLNWPAHLADYWQVQVRSAFPEAVVERYQPLLPSCTNSEKDRHVLAAAIKGHAEVIVTSNLRDFPPDSLTPWDIKAVDPASFLINLYTIEPGVLVSRLVGIANRRKLAAEDLLSRIGKSAPAFSQHLAQALGWDLPETGVK